MRKWWSTEGCAVVAGRHGYLRCNCTHLTTFASIQFPSVPLPASAMPVVWESTVLTPVVMALPMPGAPTILLMFLLALLLQVGSLAIAHCRMRHYVANTARSTRRARARSSSGRR